MPPASASRRTCKVGRLTAVCSLAVLAVFTVGCASPGPPRAPSLRLPDEVTDLQAKRIADHVELTWTTPAKTTDGLIIRGSMSAVICREDGVVKAHPAPACTPVQTMSVSAGPSKVVDVLPAGLLSDPPRVLAYRIAVLNDKGRSAGRSRPAYASSGAAPAVLDGFAVHGHPGGVEVSWVKADSGVQVERVLVAPTAPGRTAKPQPGDDVILGAGESDAGGMLDTSAKVSSTYRYSAWRVRSVPGPDGTALLLRGQATPTVEYTVRDTFPPAVPRGLAVIAGLAGTHSLDLSWQPDSDADLAGYIVYRQAGEKGAWERLTKQPTAATAYSDTAVAAGQSYAYRVTAIDQTGNESGPSAAAGETLNP